MRITENRLYLYATAFFSGMSVMAVEMGASRLLTPYFSSSQVIWTVIIGIIMMSGEAGQRIKIRIPGISTGESCSRRSGSRSFRWSDVT